MEVQKVKHQLKMEQWKEKIVACRSSGMSVGAWCKENQICCKTYYRWEKGVLQEQKPEAETATNTTAQLSAQHNKVFFHQSRTFTQNNLHSHQHLPSLNYR